MNRKNWVSALLVAMMVLSMAAMIILPSGAAATLTDEEIAALPLASKATKSDAYTEYKIDSVGELIAASHNSITAAADANADSNFSSGDVVYLTADLDIADWDTTDWATYDEETGKYTTKGRMIPNSKKTSYNIYSASATGIECDTKSEVFAALFNSFNSRNARYTYIYFDFNGLGHTIKNYYAYAPFFGGCFYGGMTVSNVIFENALVETAKQDTIWTGTYAGLVGGAADIDGGVTFNNVHVNNSKLLTHAAGNIGVFLAFSNNSNIANHRDVHILNCSVNNTVVESTAATAASTCLLVGAGDQYVSVKNTLVMNSIVKVNAIDPSYGGGFIASNRYGNLVESDVCDVAVVNCQLQTKETVAPSYAIGLNYNAKSKSTTKVNGLYATGNTWATIDGEGNLVGDAKPLTKLVIDKTNSLGGAADGFIWGDRFMVDSNVEYLFYAVAPTAGYARPSVAPTAEQVIAPMDATGAMSLLNNQTGDGYFMWAWTQDMGLITTDNPNAGPKLVTFNFANETITYITDYENKLITTPTERLQLKNCEWDAEVGKNIAPGTDWGEKTFLENASFTELPHEVTFVINDDGTHTATCNTCDEEIHNQTVACADIVPESFFVEGNFYYPSVWQSTCLCGHSWEDIDEAATEKIESPISVNLDQDSYSPANKEIVLVLSVKDGSSLSAFTTELTYDATKMTLVGYEPMVPDYACVINEENAANGKLIVAVPSVNGTVLAGDVAALTFTYTPGVTLDAPESAIRVESNMTGAIVTNDEEGTVNKFNNVVNKFTFVEALEFFVEINVIPGDVDANGAAELLDAVLITEKRNGTIHADQDGYNFQIMAADVNNDGVVNDADVDLIMRAQNGVEQIDLINCDAIPVVA